MTNMTKFKKISTLFCVLLIGISTFTLVSCGEGTYKITYDYNYEGAKEVVVETVEYNKIPSEYYPEERDGYCFNGWFLDEECSKSYSFKNALNENTTLYAGWEDITLLQSYDYYNDLFEGSLVYNSAKLDDGEDESLFSLVLDAFVSESNDIEAELSKQAHELAKKLLKDVAGAIYSKIEDFFADPYLKRMQQSIKDPSKVETVYSKLLEVEKSIEKLRSQLEMDKYKARFEQRDKDINNLHIATNSYFCAIAKHLKDLETTPSRKADIKQAVRDWSKQVVNGNSILVEVISALDRINVKIEEKSLPKLIDEYAYKFYTFEHEGYVFRETFRSVDCFVLLEAAFLSKLYYIFEAEDTTSKVTKTYDMQQANLLTQSLNTYADTFTEAPVKRHDNVIVSQVPGCEIAFGKRVEHFDFYNYLDHNRSRVRTDSAELDDLCDFIIWDSSRYDEYDPATWHHSGTVTRSRIGTTDLQKPEQFKALGTHLKNKRGVTIYEGLKKAGVSNLTSVSTFVANNNDRDYSRKVIPFIYEKANLRHIQIYINLRRKKDDIVSINSCIGDYGDLVNKDIAGDINISSRGDGITYMNRDKCYRNNDFVTLVPATINDAGEYIIAS